MLQKTTKLFLTTVAAIATINTIELPQAPNTSHSWLKTSTGSTSKKQWGTQWRGIIQEGFLWFE
ncbi:FIG00563672: hypothetical protein [Crocosphaera watsonii WH 8502]|uniref:Uncharacterized protein n=1 Tax=Crocosphaera watsonii WH 8502 TaxID=423474 RepID=T2IG42_CROWT|nr:FIG00563672: hypothetical protein [Crocosphaera watsonii WH 8502]